MGPLLGLVGGWTRIILISGMALAITLATFSAGAWAMRSGYLKRVIKPMVTNVFYVPNLINGLGASPEKLYIDVKFKNWQKIAHKREEALHRKMLIVDQDDYVPATIRLSDEAVKVKMRLKGDFLDHLQGEKWSFRFVTKGDRTVMGMKQFSVHNPGARYFIWEWLFQRALKSENILNLRYKFVQVFVNGRDLGIYALEEHFEKRLVENSMRKNGPIVRFTEDIHWQRRFSHTYEDYEQFFIEVYQSSDIDAFQTNRLLADSTLRSQLVAAVDRLGKWRDGKLSTGELFDCELLAMWYALSDLFGARHGLYWNNVRFYYNPISSRLEPIGFDAASGETRVLSYTDRFPNDIYADRIFEDTVFAHEYLRALERVSAPGYVDSLLNDQAVEMETCMEIIHSEFPGFSFDPSKLHKSQEYIRSFLNPDVPFLAMYAGQSRNGVEMTLSGVHRVGYNIVSAVIGDSIHLYPETNTTIEPKRIRQPVTYSQTRFVLPEGLIWHDSLVKQLTVNYTVLGLTAVHNTSVLPFSSFSEPTTPAGILPREPNAEDFAFISVDDDRRNISFQSGTWQIDRDIVLPSGYTVLMFEGTELDIGDGASLISYSPLQMTGVLDNPVTIGSSDSTGQGLFVINANGLSRLEHVNFVNLSSPSKANWGLTGAVTFYKSPVEFVGCFFSGSRSEDALNTIRTEFKMTNTTFSHTQSDAFDADFCKGRLNDCNFFDCGNDGIDMSGSEIRMDNVLIDGAGDKGISAGENSIVHCFWTTINNTEIGFASKDNSTLTLTHLTVSNSTIGFTAFQKKPEYGPGTIDLRKFSLEGVELPYLVETSSWIIANGTVIESDHNAVKDILYGVKYGKASK